MNLELEVTGAYLDESPRQIKTRLPVQVKLKVFEGGNTHAIVLKIPKFMAHKIIDILRFEIDNKT